MEPLESINITVNDTDIENGPHEETLNETQAIVKGILDDIIDSVVPEESIPVIIAEEPSIDQGQTDDNTDETVTESDNMVTAKFTHVLQKDAFLVFRALCKLSMKPLPDGTPDPK